MVHRIRKYFWNEYLTNMISFEGNSKYFSILLIIIALAIFPFFHELIKRGNEELADFIGIILLSIVGGLLMVSYQHMMTLFLGIEILSIAMYVLAGANRRSVNSNEASLKYFILGALASAILLFGIALYYASTASLSVLNPTIKIKNCINSAFLSLCQDLRLKLRWRHFILGTRCLSRNSNVIYYSDGDVGKNSWIWSYFSIYTSPTILTTELDCLVLCLSHCNIYAHW